MTTFPPLREHRHPGLAALIGAVTGGIGLAIYFKSLRDLLPVELAGGAVLLGSLVTGAEPFRVAELVLPAVGAVYWGGRGWGSERRRGGVAPPPPVGGSAGTFGGAPDVRSRLPVVRRAGGP